MTARAIDHPNRIPALDGLRGVALVFVLNAHFTVYGTAEIGDAPSMILYMFFASVGPTIDSFFVLSGFLITGILLDTKECPDFFRTFYLRRFLRIFPLYYAALAVYGACALFMKPLRPYFDEQGWYYAYLQNYLIASQAFRFQATAAIHHFWTLAIEEQFYLLWPVVIFLCSRRTAAAISFAFVIVSPLARIGFHHAGLPIHAELVTFARMDGIALGALLAMAARGTQGLGPLVPFRRPVIAVALLGLIALYARQLARGTQKGFFDLDEAWAGTLGISLMVFMYGAILVGAVAEPRSWTARFLSHRVPRALGTYSYAIYIVHQPVALLLASFGFSSSLAPRLFGTRVPGQLLILAVPFAISYTIALLSWHLFEKRILAWKDRFPYARTRLVDAPSASTS